MMLVQKAQQENFIQSISKVLSGVELVDLRGPFKSFHTKNHQYLSCLCFVHWQSWMYSIGQNVLVC